jgi:hypothetical protein
MKPTLLKSILITVTLGLCLTGPATANVKGLSYPVAPAHGYLTVYLTPGELNEYGAWYFPHNFYSIYTTHGKLFKHVMSQPAADEVIPDVVPLPIGSYLIVGRSETNKQVRRPIVIKAGRRAIVDLDLRNNVSAE